MNQADRMHYDVVIVGGGPAGLAAAIRLKQLAQVQGRELSVCVLEKGAEIGAHILSGAVIDPIALTELIPDWQQKKAPIDTPVTEDHFWWLSENRHFRIPQALLPPLMNNHGNYLLSLGKLTRWLAEQAEALGVDIFPGFAASDLLYAEDGRVVGVITGDMGRARDGSPKNTFSPGIELQGRYTLIAEGTRGSLTRALERRFSLREGVQWQQYGLGFKEIWSVDPQHHCAGSITHTLGWPLDNHTGGGGFIYHLADHKVAIGFVVHLNYRNPYLNPYEEFQRFKTHPALKSLLQKGKRLAYGARTINEGGLQSLPGLIFPGGALIGCSAGLVNVPRIKGSHTAMKSAMLAAEAIMEALGEAQPSPLLSAYPEQLRRSWVWDELHKVRNVKPALSRWGTLGGTLYGGMDMWLGSLGVSLPWTLRHKGADHASLLKVQDAEPIDYPAPDGERSFDRLSSVYLANIQHEENQPVHLTLADETLPIRHNLALYDAPEQRYCPAGVYEILKQDGQPRLQINAANCIHCKACDIKDPLQNITWVPPEGGSGPFYEAM